MRGTPNQIIGPNAGGPRQLPIPTSLTARVGQFYRWTEEMKSQHTSPPGVAARWTAALLALIIVGLVAFVLWYRWDSRVNHGFTFGYYGQFNTVGNALASLPDITVVGSGYNPDVTLEEFGFTLMTKNGQKTEILFLEGDPIRKLSGSELSTALLERIAKKSSNQRMQRSDR